MIWLAGAFVFVSMAAIDAWTFRGIDHLRSPRPCRMIAFALVSLGAAIGAWLGGSFTYQVAPDLRYVGFPIPCLALQLENGRWVDYVGPIPVILPFNVFTVASCFLLPVSLGLIVRRLSIGQSPPRRVPVGSAIADHPRGPRPDGGPQ